MSGQDMALILVPNAKSNIPGGPEGRNYAAIIKTQETKKSIVEKSLNFMKKYGFVPADTKVDAIDSSSSEASFDVEMPITMFYQEMLTYTPNKLYSTMRFEFHDSNVMIVFQNFSNEMLGIYHKKYGDKKSDAYNAYEEEDNALRLRKTLIGKFLIHANMDINERRAFRQELDKYFNDIVTKEKTYEQLVKNGEAKWLDAQGVVKQLTENPVPGAKYTLAFLDKPESKNVLLAISEKRWRKQVKGMLDNIFMSFSEELNGEIEGIAEDGNQTWEIVDGKLLPIDPKLKKTFIKKGWDFYNNDN